MKCTITRESFLPHLQKVVNIVCRKAALPILHNIKLEAGGNELKLTANCLDMNIDTVMTAEVEKEGSTTLPAGRLLDIVNRLKKKEITLECDKNLSLNNSKFSINYDCRSQMQQSFKRRVALFVPDEKFAKPVEP